jgi:hypothetical protein
MPINWPRVWLAVRVTPLAAWIAVRMWWRLIALSYSLPLRTGDCIQATGYINFGPKAEADTEQEAVGAWTPLFQS